MSSNRTSVSMPNELFEKARQRQKELSFASFSDYIQHLIRQDKDAQTEANAPSPAYRANNANELTEGQRAALEKLVDSMVESRRKTDPKP